MSGINFGRFALDRYGRLWPYAHRHFVKAVAIVTVRPLAKRAVAVDDAAEPPESPSPIRKRKLDIDLSQVPSGMELAAQGWKDKYR